MADFNEELLLAKMLGNLYTEVFQRRQPYANSATKRSIHILDIQEIKEDIHTVLHSSSDTWAWGPGGVSPFVSGRLHVDWSALGYWS